MRLYVIRHGETFWNRERRFQGQKGSDLNEQGIRLTEVTKEAMKDIHFDLCISSPILRARHTAEIILEGRDVPIIEDDRLMEIGFGEYEGQYCAGNQSVVDDSWYQNFYHRPLEFEGAPGGETIPQVIERAAKLYDELAHDRSKKDQTILISCHGCVLRAFLNKAYDNPKDFWQGSVPLNCAVTIVDIEDGKASFVEKDRIYYDRKDAVNYFVIK